jgi:purine-binding chemotaxis protein CheW
MEEQYGQDTELLEQEEATGLEGSEKYLTFALGNEEFGINIRDVTEIIGIQKITVMPDVADYIKGVINLRGKVIPVIDMRLRFGLSERDYDERTCIVVVNLDSTSVGLIVDTVSEVLDIEEKNIDPPPRVASGGTSREFIEGLGRVEEEVKILLDIKRVLFDRAISEAVQQAQQG